MSGGARSCRSRSRSVARLLVLPALALLLLGACSPEPDPVGEPSPSHGTAEPSASSSPTPSSSPASPAPSATNTPPAAPTPTDGADATAWEAPEDPTAEGPTAAPDLPEVRGSSGEELVLPTGIVVTVTSISTTSLIARTPGEYAGPAVVVEVHVANESSSPQDLDSAVVSLIAEDGEVGIATWASPYAPLQGEVASGESAEGTYVFMLDPAPDRAVTVSVNPSAGEPLAVFTGHTS